jgi:phosphinothricin acetyltransferase
MKPQLNYKNITKKHWPDIKAIFESGIVSGNATFDDSAGSWYKWNASHCKEARILAEAGDEVVGWAALRPTSTRNVYSGVAESSIYISDKFQNCGIGNELLKRMIQSSEIAYFWTLEAYIFPENHASIALHKKNNYELIVTRKKIGVMKNGTWRDVLLFERRSKVNGK